MERKYRIKKCGNREITVQSTKYGIFWKTERVRDSVRYASLIPRYFSTVEDAKDWIDLIRELREKITYEAYP